jgi:hypothetical protein
VVRIFSIEGRASKPQHLVNQGDFSVGQNSG